MSNNDLKKLLSIVSAQEMDEICRPLFDCFNINTFIYTRAYKDNSYWTLSNRADWIEHFHIEKYVVPQVDFSSLKSGHYLNLQELGIPEKQIITARESFNADYWLNIVKNHKTHYEIIGVATNRGNFDVLDFYLNKIEILEHFYFYFKEKAQGLIRAAEKNKISLPGQELT